MGVSVVIGCENILAELAPSSQQSTLRRFTKMALSSWTGIWKRTHTSRNASEHICHIFSLLTETELKEITPELLSRQEKHVAEGVAVDDALINHHLTDPYIFSESIYLNY